MLAAFPANGNCTAAIIYTGVYAEIFASARAVACAAAGAVDALAGGDGDGAIALLVVFEHGLETIQFIFIQVHDIFLFVDIHDCLFLCPPGLEAEDALLRHRSFSGKRSMPCAPSTSGVSSRAGSYLSRQQKDELPSHLPRQLYVQKLLQVPEQ